MPESVSNTQSKSTYTQTIKISLWVFKRVFKLKPLATISYIISTIINSLSSLVYSFVIAKVIDTLVYVLKTGSSDITRLYPIFILFIAYYFLTYLASSLRYTARRRISTEVDISLDQEFYFKMSDLGVATIEHPEVADLSFMARTYLHSIRSFFYEVAHIIGSAVAVVSTGAIVIGIFPTLIPIILVAYIPQYFIDRTYRKSLYNLNRSNMEERRKAHATVARLENVKNLKEIIISQATKFLDKKNMDFITWYKNEENKLFDKWEITNFITSIAIKIIILVSSTRIFINFLSGLITVGAVTFQIRTVFSFGDSIGDFIQELNNLAERGLRIKDVYELFNLEPHVKNGDKKLPKLEKGPEINISNLDFSYPNSDVKVLKNIDLHIKSGEKVAIVGPNGAGKTTLVKLICRFYISEKGNIKINGYDIKDIETESFYNNLGVLFQEYNLYPQLTVKENIYVGKSDDPIDEIAIRSAAQTADAMDFIKEYKKEFDQYLSQTYKEGIDPSTGQWQKLAIARFFYRNAPLVIFDEPTAAIDAVSEYKIFSQIYEFFEGKTVVIISHRYSTVRNADRIIVLDKGQIIEEGTHEHLMSLNGKYAEGFRLQAEGYSN